MIDKPDNQSPPPAQAPGCGNCRFCLLKTCRRHSPKWRNPDSGVGEWPIVDDDQWCGDWRALK